MKISGREKIMLAGLGILAMLGGGYFGYTKYSSERTRLAAERDAAVAELNRVKQKAGDLQAIEEDLAELLQIQEENERLVTKDEEIPQLLRDTANMFATAGVKLDGFVPGREEPSTVPEILQEKVQVRAAGTYRQIMTLFKTLTKARRLIGISEFTLTSNDQNDDPVLGCTMTMVVFFTKK